MAEKRDISNHFSLKTLRFFMQLVGMWPVGNSRERLISNLSLFYIAATVIIGVTAQSIDFYYSMGDLQTLSYNLPNTFTAANTLIKLLKFVVNRNEVMKFNAYTEHTFWKVKYNTEEYQILDECNRKSMKMVITHFIFTQSVVVLFVFVPIVETAGMNVTDRILPINVHFDLPSTESPYYEITYTLEAAAAVAVGLCTTTFAGYLSTTNFYAVGQFEILRQRLGRAFFAVDSDDVNEPTVTKKTHPNFLNVRECIKQHQLLILYMERIENLFSTILLAQTLGSILMLCFSGFQVVLGDVETSFFRFLHSVQFLITASVQLFLFAWPCQEIIVASEKVAEGAYRAFWYCLPYTEEGRSCRRSIIIVIMRARKPCVLTVGKFTPMSLQTFGQVFRSALSYLTVLRQMNEDNDA